MEKKGFPFEKENLYYEHAFVENYGDAAGERLKPSAAGRVAGGT